MIEMKYICIIIVMLLINSNTWARWAYIPLKDAVKKSDLIVIGTLKDVKEHTKDEIDYGEGIITVDTVLYGKLPQKEKKLSLKWQNRTGLACPRVEHKHKENKKGIWLLNIKKDSSVIANHPSRFQTLDKKDEILKFIKKLNKNTKKLWGIEEVKINKDGSVTLTDAKNGMWFPDKKGGFKPSVTLKKGETCDLIDGDHDFMKFKFEKIKDGKITFTVTDKFDARSFGGKIKTEIKTITIKPYKE